METVLPVGIEVKDNDGYELVLSVDSDYAIEAQTDDYLRGIIAYTQHHGFSRFVGAIRGKNDEGVKTFFFSRPDYFDEDDMLVNDFEISQRVNALIHSEF